MNETVSYRLMQALHLLGVREICICAGARNLPLVCAIERWNQKNPSSNFQIYSFFDERSASFFSLGLSLGFNRPAVVLTTSGTAVSETLSAVIEAYYQQVPLIVLSADRPKKYRGSGAPQAMEQANLLQSHCEMLLDVAADEDPTFADLNRWKKQGPLHLNICFDEPLRGGFDESKAQLQWHQQKDERTSDKRISKTPTQEIVDPIVVCGPLKNSEKEFANSWLQQQKIPFYAECLSGLRECESLRSWLMHSLPQDIKGRSWIRLGNVPTLRAWRDLENSNTPVFNLTNSRWTGLSREARQISWEDSATLSLQCTDHWRQVLKNHLVGNRPQESLSPALSDFESEMIFLLGQEIEKQSPVALYLGNSLPIRHFDQVFFPQKGFDCVWQGNRGMNGIDGQLSTFLGWAEAQGERECYAVVGDLTALYDLQALWIIPQLRQKKIRIVVVNNGGGQIFRQFRSGLMVNSHNLHFLQWAKMFGLNSWTGPIENLVLSKIPREPIVIELISEVREST